MTWVCVALGAALGAPLRFLVAGWLDGRPPPGTGTVLPWGTLAVNVVGSLVLGSAAAMALDGALLGLIGVGFCGGLTTYSSFAVQTVALGWRRGSAYAVLTVGLSVAACALGWVLGG